MPNRMYMTIVAESGATKTDWRTADTGLRTAGINLSVMPYEKVASTVEEAASALLKDGEKAEKIFFYAAGLVSEDSAKNLKSVLREFFPEAEIFCASDLMAASRALWGDGPGISAVLGTGSNSCLYDGSRVVRNIRPGGFILGDEGGGVSLGRRFVADFIKERVPDALAVEFSEKFRATYSSIVENVYGGGGPSYLASFAPFLVGKAGEYDYLQDLIKDNFRDFMVRMILPYRTGNECLEVGAVGSFGFACRDIVAGTGREYGVEFVRFLASPAETLVAYHCGGYGKASDMVSDKAVE